MHQPSDDEDFTAFATVVWPQLYRTAVMLVGDAGLAEDLVQTALAKAYASWGRIRDPSRAREYVRAILVNTARSWFRRRAWSAEVSTASVPETGHEEIDTYRPSVLEALSELPARQRAVVVLRFYEDMSVADTATALRIREGTVKSQTAHALRKLRLVLGERLDVTKEGNGR